MSHIMGPQYETCPRCKHQSYGYARCRCGATMPSWAKMQRQWHEAEAKKEAKKDPSDGFADPEKTISKQEAESLTCDKQVSPPGTRYIRSGDRELVVNKDGEVIHEGKAIDSDETGVYKED